WDKEYQRFQKLVTDVVIDKQQLDEVYNQRQAADASREEYKAKVQSATAACKESKALEAKSEADVLAAKARVEVARADEKRVSALVKFADIVAPFDCVVVRRNVHTGHFVQAGPQPLFVVARIDLLRVVAEIPEADAGLMKVGLEGTVRVQ